METSDTKLNGLHESFSLRQRFSHFIWTIEGKNFYVSVTYPQYYWKVSIALRGCLEKFFIVLGNFYCKTSHFTQKKNAPYNKGTFDDRFYKVVHENNIKIL